jgi:hypothetical protein
MFLWYFATRQKSLQTVNWTVQPGSFTIVSCRPSHISPPPLPGVASESIVYSLRPKAPTTGVALPRVNSDALIQHYMLSSVHTAPIDKDGSRVLPMAGQCHPNEREPQMITGEIESKVDHIRDTMWSGESLAGTTLMLDLNGSSRIPDPDKCT